MRPAQILVAGRYFSSSDVEAIKIWIQDTQSPTATRRILS